MRGRGIRLQDFGPRGNSIVGLLDSLARRARNGADGAILKILKVFGKILRYQCIQKALKLHLVDISDGHIFCWDVKKSKISAWTFKINISASAR